MTSDVEVKGIATVTFDPLPFDSVAKLLGARDKIDWNTLLALPDKDNHMEIVNKTGQVNLLNILKIYEQQFTGHFNLISGSCSSNKLFNKSVEHYSMSVLQRNSIILNDLTGVFP